MLIDYLKKDLRVRQKKNKSYSIRAFARFLKMDPSTLSKILSGNRKLSYTTAKKIVRVLPVDSSVKNLLLLTYAESERKFLIDEDFFVPDEAISAELMSKWEYYAVLSFIEVDDVFNVENIALKLGTNSRTVSAIIENLETLGVIKIENGRLILTNKALTAPKNFNKKSLVKVHRETIEKSLEFLEKDRFQEADFSGITMALSSKRLQEVTDRIKDFRRSLAQFLNNPEDVEDQVYRMNIQFFPLSEKKQK